MRWQVFPYNQGYDYKNSISNGAFFNLAARLGKYTGNSTYVDAANKWYDWCVAENLISSTYVVVDGIVVDGCNDHGHTEQWTYNLGVFLYGAAAMWNITQTNPAYSADASKWEARVTGLLGGTNVFFKDDTASQPVLTEIICEPEDTCAIDSSTFKAYLARWMRVTAQVAPFTASQVASLLQYSAPAAAVACSGAPVHSSGGVTCGQKWYTGSFDGKTGIGMQMTALEVMQTLLESAGPVNEATGISKGDASAGSQEVGQLGGTVDNPILDITTGDKAGAAILTILLCVSSMAGAWWILK